MEKITLTPGEWTRIHASTAFQVIGQHAVRMALGTYGEAAITAPAADAPYLKTQDYNPKVIRLEDFGFSSTTAIYLMPDASHPVEVVVL
jgi:hypothetical protein